MGCNRWRMVFGVAFAALLSVLPKPAFACSAVACIGGGPEMRGDFLVVVKHAGKPLPGVRVRVTSSAEGTVTVRFSGLTASDGLVHVATLAPGEYWLNADLLGISAADQCFHVAQRASRRARHRATYEWGSFAAATQRAAGRLVDAQAGTGGTPLWNLAHRRSVPISGSTVQLKNPFADHTLATKSDLHGAFAFDHVPNGIYVLHVEGGNSNRPFDGTDQLIRISSAATGDTLVLTRQDPGGGSCGGTLLEVVTAK